MCYGNCQKLMYTLARSNVCSAWERAGKHHANPSGAVRHTDCQDVLLSSGDARSQSGFVSLSLQFIYSRFVLCKAAPLVPCHAAALIEGQWSVAQKEREASRGQLCSRKAESKLIARYQGPLSPGCKLCPSLTIRPIWLQQYVPNELNWVLRMHL